MKDTHISLANNYFLLYHGTSIEFSNTLVIDENIDDEDFFEISALLLSLNRKNFAAVTSLTNFQMLTNHFTDEKIDNLELLYKLQNSIVHHFLEHRTTCSIHHLHNAFTYLHDEGLLDKPSLEKLLSLFDPSTLDKIEEDTTCLDVVENNFNVQKETILEDISDIKKSVKNLEELENIVHYLENQKFSIGVTGVMNSGKSTMLNALMGKELLGASMIPETANLTVIKYSKTPLAKVFYWNKIEWEQIVKSADSIQEIKTFVNETKRYFKDDLVKYILNTSREDVIAIDKLSDYTSASAQEKKCNLIKYVELFNDLEFLQEGIEIVDTPGIDDIVIQREEITKEYVSHCDVMVHLMNVSQSATKKDIDFIIDAVLYQNVTKVLIVITRVDMVSANDVKEVIAYTKESVSKRLHEQNSDAKLDFILQTLHFIAFSGKMALLHKTGKADTALEAGYSLEASGIIEIEEYLKETLFSNKNARSSLIIRSAKNRLQKLLDKELEMLKFEKKLLFKSKGETDEELATLKAKKSMKLQSLQLLKEQISGYELEVSEYLSRLQSHLDDELKKLQIVLKQRLLDETTYHLQKSKKTAPLSDVSRIIDTALKNGIVDIIRDYRYKFIKKSSKIYEVITLQFDELQENPKEIVYDNESFAEEFKTGFLTFSNTALITSTFALLSKGSLEKMERIDAELSELIKGELNYVEVQIREKALHLSQTLLEEFFRTLKEPIDTMQNSLDENEKLLQNHLLFLEEDETLKHEKSMELTNNIKNLEQIASRHSI